MKYDGTKYAKKAVKMAKGGEVRRTGTSSERSGSSSTYGAGGADRVRPKAPRKDKGKRKEGKATERNSR